MKNKIEEIIGRLSTPNLWHLMNVAIIRRESGDFRESDRKEIDKTIEMITTEWRKRK